jgi:hypothetical protein
MMLTYCMYDELILAVHCDDPSIPHANNSGVGTVYGTIRNYTCDPGYTDGDPSGSITCGADRQWTNISCIGKHVCVIQCF